ncbi:hypothetical protein F5050DRAFT_1811164 [Lentinula boryana]|uniref:Uncharacterized protein n=1 Tax=Lentinula boryana TaxID=40481 RepID=A0ABQ8Q4T9_9AGAR|nr:hypothetical protein F5050DRAFT_1811164 [Lentinula boryana]
MAGLVAKLTLSFPEQFYRLAFFISLTVLYVSAVWFYFNRYKMFAKVCVLLASDVPARLWLESPGFGLEALGFGLEKTKPGPSGTAPAWPGLALAQAGAFRYYL